MDKSEGTVLQNTPGATVGGHERQAGETHESGPVPKPPSMDASTQATDATLKKPKSLPRRILKQAVDLGSKGLLLALLIVGYDSASETTRFAVGITIFLAVLLLLLWTVPKWQTNALTGIGEGRRFELENEARKTLAQLIAGVLVVTGVYGTWRTLQISEQGQVNERFNKAIDQLGAEALTTRVGAIYSLERLSEDSATERSRIIEILTAYVRENASLEKISISASPSPGPSDQGSLDERIDHSKFPSADIQAILDILQRQPVPITEGSYDSIDLSDINLYAGQFQFAYLHKAWFFRSELPIAIFVRATLTEAKFNGANLRGASFQSADLKNADFEDANLEKAHFDGADVAGADFTNAKGLTAEQIKKATNYDKAKLPSVIAESLRLSQP